MVIINLNKAITDGGLILIDPENDTPNPNNVFAGKINDSGNINRSHTLTIAGGYLYVATLNQYIPVWDLNQNPTSPPYLGAVYINNSKVQVHEMFAKPVSSVRANIYAACVAGGLQVIDVSYTPSKGSPPTGLIVNSITQHLYDFDRAYPNQRESGDSPFDYRVTHSAWPTDDEQYIFTTDELSVWPHTHTRLYSASDPNLYSSGTLKSPFRNGAYLKTWKKSLLTQNSSFKGGYYISEEHPWGITNLTQIDTNWVPNSIHQMYVKGNRMYVSHYTQGFRYLDISDPENIIELGYYDDYPHINANVDGEGEAIDNLFFRQNWFNGIYGVFRDPVRTTICYAGGSDGFYIFDLTAIPYPPTNLVVTPNGQGHYVLSWTPSQSLNAQSYDIYRAAVPCCEPYDLPLYATINAYQGGSPVTSWEDVSSRTGSGDGMYYYEISMKNTVGKNSVHSNRVGVGIGQPTKRTAEEEETKEQLEQSEYSLSDNYPNPFNPSTRISYSLKEDALVSLKVYDVLGTQVAELVNSQQSQGTYDVNFSAIGLSSGIYIYRLTAMNGDRIEFSDTKRMILVK